MKHFMRSVAFVLLALVGSALTVEPAAAANFTIQYDTGTATGTTGVASQMVGNRFNSYKTAGSVGGALPGASYTVTRITFDMVNTFFSSAVFSIYDQPNGTTANQVTSMGRGVMQGLNTLDVMSPTTANVVQGGSFLAGIFQFMPASTAVAVDTGTVNGQGFHAISLNDGTTGTMLTSLAGLNAIFRVSVIGDLPVELSADVCGDGVTGSSEDCDPGADVADDCCDAFCMYESLGDSCDGAPAECFVQNTCDDQGMCEPGGFESMGASCGGAPAECFAQDTCNGGGVCDDNGFESDGVSCGSATDTECSDADTCDGAGVCDPRNELGGVSCNGTPAECFVQDTCDGMGVCDDNGVESDGVACGSATDAECSDADTCDGAGVCDPRDELGGVSCGSAGTECIVQDTCDGTGGCTSNGFEPDGLSCGSATDTDCTDSDTCDGAGGCQDNHESPGTGCDDADACTDTDECSAGVCTGSPITNCAASFCQATPETGCRLSGPWGRPHREALLRIKEGTARRRHMRIRWSRGADSTTNDEFCLASDTGQLPDGNYHVCVYDSASQLLLETVVLPGGDCDGQSCWEHKAGKCTYRDKSGTIEGVRYLQLRGGAPGKSSWKLKAVGQDASLPDLALLGGLVAPVTVQLLIDDESLPLTDNCWQTVFDGTDVIRNTAQDFKARTRR